MVSPKLNDNELPVPVKLFVKRVRSSNLSDLRELLAPQPLDPREDYNS